MKRVQDFITVEGIKSWLPVLTMIITMVLAFSAAQTKIALLEQSVVTIKASQEELKSGQNEILTLLRESNNSLETRVVQLSLDVTRLKTLSEK